ncbi:MAG TPA: M48 family metallopeptidase [Patescibacteria group bacterium]|nr:M48 family metallopeptidase [Patescibacteria group bacterium]
MKKLDYIMYRGQEYEVSLIIYPGKTTQVIFRDNRFIVYINNKIQGVRATQEAAQHLKSWMIVKAEELIKKRTAEYSNLIGVNYNTIRIKDTKTRWGSCSSKGNLNFNFRILMAPEQVMDYIIVHELCHLRYMNHGKDFWNTVAQYMPDYEKKKEWLKVNGMKLYAI